MSVKEINYLAEFEDVTNRDSITVVDFMSLWCIPCKTLAPKMEELASKYPNVKFYKVDVDRASDVATQENINAMPTIVFYKNGQRIDTVVGANLSLIKFKLEKYA